MKTVLDTSAILALLWNEPGSDRVADTLDEAAVSAVNFAEFTAKLSDRGANDAQIDEILASFELDIHDFDAEQADRSGRLRGKTRSLGLSLGDRCCLAVAQSLDARILTADRAWAGLDIGVEIEVIR